MIEVFTKLFVKEMKKLSSGIFLKNRFGVVSSTRVPRGLINHFRTAATVQTSSHTTPAQRDSETSNTSIARRSKVRCLGKWSWWWKTTMTIADDVSRHMTLDYIRSSWDRERHSYSQGINRMSKLILIACLVGFGKFEKPKIVATF